MKTSITEINNSLPNKNIKCIGYLSSNEKALFTCKKGHVWFSKFSNVKFLKRGCPHCSKRAKLNIETINNLLRMRGIKCVKYGGSSLKTSTFKCICGNEWKTNLNSVKDRLTGCPRCSGKEVLTIEKLNYEIKHKGIECIEFNKGVKQKSKFKCQHGHIWESSSDNVKNNNTGCPICAKTGYDISKKGTLYCLISQNKNYIKIGISNNYKRRIKMLRNATPFTFEVLKLFSSDGLTVRNLEKDFHKILKSANLKGFDGATEWFENEIKIQIIFKMLGV